MSDISQDQGMDYGRGIQNVNPETGIRYGVIPVNRVFYWHYYADVRSCECYEGFCGCDFLPEYVETDCITAESDSSGDVWVFKSEFYTYAKFCSPCAPGACYLVAQLHPEEGLEKAYCLGPDFFETGGTPYRVFRVDTNEEVKCK